VLLKDQRFQDLESSSVAYVLSKAIKKIGAFDLIMTGRQAGEWDLGQTGLILGEMLGIPTINLARNVSVEEGHVVVEKIMPDGYELVRAGMPSLVTLSNEVGELRFASLKNTLMSKRQPIDLWRAEDLDIDPERLQKMALAALSPPPDVRRPCHFTEGDSPEEIGENLAMTLKKEMI
jgi:electron transfer flavoprotein beta subunit